MTELDDVNNETIETIEKTLDILEETKVVVKNNPVLLLGVGVVSLGLGGLAGYYIAKRQLSLRFEERLENEVADAKRFFATLHKDGDLATPAAAAEKLLPPETKKALASYQGQAVEVVTPENPLTSSVEEVISTVVDADNTVVEEVTIERSVWVNGQALSPDQAEKFVQERDRSRPFPITQEEFFENEDGYDQHQLTYYAKDGGLADSGDDPVEDEAELIGDEYVKFFGFVSGDNNVVYIRNNKRREDYEIMRSSGSFAADVLGFKDEDEIRHSMTRGRRRGFQEE